MPYALRLKPQWCSIDRFGKRILILDFVFMIHETEHMMPETKAFDVPGWREQAWSKLTKADSHGLKAWDLLVIGGGITGAGVLREAARRGLGCALIEQRDFAWGTSSRSSNMVHGGLRYLEKGQLKLARASVRERRRLLSEASGLVNPMGFLYSDYRGAWPGRWPLAGLLTVYDSLAGRWNHGYYPAHEYFFIAPHIRLTGLKGGTRFGDAVTDDARLVFRVLREAQRDGGVALNYVSAEALVKKKGRVCGAVVRDRVTGQRAEVPARGVVNATGAWADRLRQQVGGRKRIRPLRGSHLVFPFWRLPVGQAISLAHPSDRRYVFALPWQGVTLVGNTDLDHDGDLDAEASITVEEVDYLLDFVGFQFPSLHIRREDILSTWSGVRPVIGTGKKDPSKERRDHAIWVEDGLVSVSGGKLTTFRLIALDVLRRMASGVPGLEIQDTGQRVFEPATFGGGGFEKLQSSARDRLSGRYGMEARAVVDGAGEEGFDRIPGTNTLWAEVRYGAREENVVHLEDLLLRRTRLGLVLKKGGAAFFDGIKAICQEEMGWSDSRWQEELESYLALYERCHSVPSETG
jgi:glycerol-3-phosphate dehydrogenase